MRDVLDYDECARGHESDEHDRTEEPAQPAIGVPRRDRDHASDGCDHLPEKRYPLLVWTGGRRRRVRPRSERLDEMVGLLREGKGLEKALRDYLEAKEGELERIEAGENLPEYMIVAVTEGDDEAEPELPGFVPQAPPAGAEDFAPLADDDIPF